MQPSALCILPQSGCVHIRRQSPLSARSRTCARPRSVVRAEVGESDQGINTQSETSTSSSEGSTLGAWAAVGAVALGAAIFVGTRLSTGPISLRTLEEQAVDLDVALQNNRPTVVEFYAGWCEVCRELAPDVYQVEEEFKDKINFVMLNIENRKWAPEMAEYRVGGIPHFVFLNSKGQPEAAAVGRLPQQVLQKNIRALSEGKQLPYRGSGGTASSVSSRNQGMMAAPPISTTPRSHG